jgi:arylsulfatase
VIIFTTDNGLMQGAHGLAGKWHPYEESIRVPLIIRDPRMASTKRGTLDDSFTLNIDLATTIMGAANLKPSTTMQGRDISDLYRPSSRRNTSSTPPPWREDFFYELPLAQFPDSTAVVTKEWKYVKWPSKGNYEQLFYLPKDRYELHDLLRNATMMSHSPVFTPDFVQQILELMRRRYNQLEEVAISPKDNANKPKCERGRKYDGT